MTMPKSTGHAAGPLLSDAEILAQIPAARERARRATQAGLRAQWVRYSISQELLFLTLTHGTVIGLTLPRIPALRRATPRQRAAVELIASGAAVRWEALDVDLSVPALIREAIGEAALRVLFASEGGRSTSDRKAAAARRNGAKGGRPRKAQARD